MATALTSTTTKVINLWDNSSSSASKTIGISIDLNRMYVGFLYNTFDETNLNGAYLMFYPITKP